MLVNILGTDEWVQPQDICSVALNRLKTGALVIMRRDGQTFSINTPEMPAMVATYLNNQIKEHQA